MKFDRRSLESFSTEKLEDYYQIFCAAPVFHHGRISKWREDVIVFLMEEVDIEKMSDGDLRECIHRKHQLDARRMSEAKREDLLAYITLLLEGPPLVEEPEVRSIDDIVSAQNWTDNALKDLLFMYIENQGSMDALRDFLDQRAQAENE